MLLIVLIDMDSQSGSFTGSGMMKSSRKRYSYIWKKRKRSLRLKFLASSRIISQHRPHSFKPARRIRSTVASVWPFLSSTPFFLARRGNMCPGRRKSSARASCAAQALAVMPRSFAEIPVVVET